MHDSTGLPPLPDCLSTEPKCPCYDPTVREQDIGIRFNCRERSDVEVYCISEGWVKVQAGETLDLKCRPSLLKLMGMVEPFDRQRGAKTADGSPR